MGHKNAKRTLLFPLRLLCLTDLLAERVFASLPAGRAGWARSPSRIPGLWSGMQRRETRRHTKTAPNSVLDARVRFRITTLAHSL
jgi:hypothetical protein